MNRNPEHETAYNMLDATRGQNKLWHRISLNGFKNVIMCGEIHANTNNRYEVTYGQSKNCLGRLYQAISLFDFDSSSVEQIIEQECSWVHFLKDFEPLTIVMGINKNLIDPKDLIDPMAIPYEQILKRKTKDGIDYIPTFIPRVEVLCMRSIPVNLISEVLIVRHGKGFRFERIPFDQDTLTFANKLFNEWTIERERESENHPIFSVADLIANLEKEIF